MPAPRSTTGILGEMSAVFDDAEAVIRAEYQRLCEAFGLSPVALDVYVCDDSSREKTALGLPVSNCDPLYSGTRGLMALPLSSTEDQWPTTLPPLPPTTLAKHEWPVWRIELWHEVIHQVSNDIQKAWDPKEPPRTRTNGSRSTTGHGAGWFFGIQHAAVLLSVDADALDELLDQ
jgi:hypothetical protein